MTQYQGVWSLQSAAQLQSTQRWVTDPLFDYTTLLLQADDAANGAQNNTFLDSSSNAFAITRNGNTTQGSFTPFSSQPGAWGNFFNGSSDFLNIGSGYPASLDLGSGNFTIEGWVYLQATTKQLLLGNLNDSNGTCTFFVILNNTSASARYEIKFGSSAFNLGAGTLPTNQWVHVCVMRSGTSIFLFENGAQVGATQTYSGSIPVVANQMRVGGAIAGQYPLSGYASNLRMVIGSTVYSTSGFTVPTTPLTAITNTALLTCQSNRFFDSSANAISITTSGTPSVQAFSPFAPQFQWTPSVIGGSGYFDGTGDYLTAANNAAFNFGSGEFCVETWFYPTAAAQTQRGLITLGVISSGAGAWLLWLNASGFPAFYVTTGGTSGTATNLADTKVATTNAWTHIAVARTGNTLSLFVNGSRVATTAYSSTVFNDTSNTLHIAASNGTSVAQGYLAGSRIVKGSTPYDATQSTITIPTSPPTAITNTSLLLNFTNAGIYDGTMKNNLETTGNVAINTNIVKYGSGSLFFDGSGDYLTMPNVQQIVGVMNPINTLTIECWVFPTARPAFNESGLIGDMNPTAGTNYWSFGPNSNGYLFWYAFQSAQQTATSTFIPLNTWTHIAVSIQTGRIRLFVNGILQAFTGDAALTITSGSVGYLTMGQWNNSTNYAYTGYVDDLRITRGVARYITSFTPPTVALPRQ